MGKGLSPLQRTILITALANRTAEGRDDTCNGADVYLAEVLHRHFHFPFKRDYWLRDKSDAAILAEMRKLPGSHRFSLVEIGASKYRAAQAALSRAAARLQQRGQVVRYNGSTAWWAGVRLTPQGIATAEKLSANTRQKSAKIQPIRKGPACAAAVPGPAGGDVGHLPEGGGIAKAGANTLAVPCVARNEVCIP